MKRYLTLHITIFILSVILLAGCANQANTMDSTAAQMAPDSLVVLWTSGDPDVANKVCFMYTRNAKTQGWFDNVRLIVWGPSAKLLAEDKQLQQVVKSMIADGIDVTACKACADSYGVSDDLAALGIDVKYMGKPLTRYLKAKNWKTLTF